MGLQFSFSPNRNRARSGLDYFTDRIARGASDAGGVEAHFGQLLAARGVGNETVELDLVPYFNSLAGWLRGWAKLQAATSCGAETVDGCRSSRNRRETN